MFNTLFRNRVSFPASVIFLKVLITFIFLFQVDELLSTFLIIQVLWWQIPSAVAYISSLYLKDNKNMEHFTVCVSPLHSGHVINLCIVPILAYVLLK